MRSRLLRLLLTALRPVRRLLPRSIVTLTLLVALTGPFAFQREARLRCHDSHAPAAVCVDGGAMRFDEAMYWTMCIFAAQTGPLGYPHSLWLRLLSFLAPALTASALFGAILRLIEERSPIFLGSFDRHVVIGGLGTLGTTLTHYFMRHGRQVIAIERQGDLPAVADMRAAGANLVLVGDMTAAATLTRVRAGRAREVFFVSSSDVANLDAAFQARRVSAADPDSTHPTVYAHVYDDGLSDALEGQLHGDGNSSRIVTFNSYRFAARALIGDLLRERLVGAIRVAPGVFLQRTDWPAAGEALPTEARGSKERVLHDDRDRLVRSLRVVAEGAALRGDRFAVIGLGRFGRSVLRELLSVAAPDARFLVIEQRDRELPIERDGLAGVAARCEFLSGDATGVASLKRVTEFAPTAALICMDSDLNNLRLAAALRRGGVRAVVRMSGPDAAELSRGFAERGITIVGFSRLFRASIPLLTHERRLRACIDVDFNHTTDIDHLFYVSRVTGDERRRLGAACVRVHELPGGTDCASIPPELALVWHQEAVRLAEDELEDGPSPL